MFTGRSSKLELKEYRPKYVPADIKNEMPFMQGYVAFNEKGDRIALTQIEQMWGKCILPTLFRNLIFYDFTLNIICR